MDVDVESKQSPPERMLPFKENFVLKRTPFLIFLPILFLVVGASAGFAIWQMSQTQRQQRDLSSVKTLLEQTNQQVQFLKQENEAALKLRTKLQKDLQTSQKQLGDAKKQITVLQQQFAEAQNKVNLLATDNGNLRAQLITAQQQSSAYSKLRSTTPTQKIESPTTNANSNFIPPP
jgi:septal ring factor EnvC (AmiA/AmiB activator)